MTTSLFIATHPRSTSTALERAFLTRTGSTSDNNNNKSNLADTICIHEPFGEPFYYGPERMSHRFPATACAKVASTYPHELRYSDIVAEIDRQHAQEGKSIVVIKDMAQYIVTPRATGRSDMIIDESFFSHVGGITKAESDCSSNSSNYENTNNVGAGKRKVVVLIRAPHLSVPSYYRCCMPPLSARTGFDFYDPDEAGYRELRILYDRLSSSNDGNAPLIIDSADLLRSPRQVIQRVCQHAGIDFRESMLQWEENSPQEQQLFQKWNGFHDDALNSRGFKQEEKPSVGDSAAAENKKKNSSISKPSNAEFEVDYDNWTADWNKKFNPEQVAEIRAAVERNLDDYLYLRQFCEQF
jgi:DNA repair and recombination protein RAD54B